VHDVSCACVQVETWLGATLNALKHERTAERDVDSLKARVEGLHRQKQGREADMDRIKTMARELIDDPTTGDKHRLRETLAGVQGKWNELTERLVQMISYTVMNPVSWLCFFFFMQNERVKTMTASLSTLSSERLTRTLS
jgi:transposase-like protein